MVIVFLDFDGVTHPWPTDEPGMFNRECLKNLNKAFENISVEIVVTSTWRESMRLDEIRDKLDILGDLVNGVTPVIDDPFLHHVRYQEIRLYLESHSKPDERWVAIDDEKGNFPKQLNNIFFTNSRKGFEKSDIELFKKLLVKQL